MSDERPWKDNWEIVEQLDSTGGQGFTNLVRRKSEPKELAVLKILKKHNCPKARGRMRVEVASLEQIKLVGGNVPQVLEHNTEEAASDSRLYVVMEYIEGLTLEAHIVKHGPLSLEDSMSVALSLMNTIGKGHEEGILHRDIKPKNLIFDESNKSVAVLDYGISFNADMNEELTQTGEDFRNEFIVLPETNTAGDNHRDARSDVACIAGILYFCLTGHKPGYIGGKVPHRRPDYSISGVLKGDARAAKLDEVLDRALCKVESRINDVATLRSRLEGVLSASTLPPTDPLEALKELSRQIKETDRKTHRAEMKASAVKTLQELNNYFDKQLKQSHGEMITVNFVDVPSGGPQHTAYERLDINPHAFLVSLKNYEFRAHILYNFVASGDNLVVLRCPGKQQAAKSKFAYEAYEEIASCERGESIKFATIKQDADEQLIVAFGWINSMFKSHNSTAQ